MTSSIPSTIPLNTPKTIQTPSSLVNFVLVSYAVLLISNGFKSSLVFIGWLSMTLVILGLMLHMFGYDLNIYGSDLNSFHHSDLHIQQFSPVSHHFPTMTPYPHGDTIPLVFDAQYDIISNIS